MNPGHLVQFWASCIPPLCIPIDSFPKVEIPLRQHKPNVHDHIQAQQERDGHQRQGHRQKRPPSRQFSKGADYEPDYQRPEDHNPDNSRVVGLD